MTVLRVGFDTGPLYGQKSGIGFAVEAMREALADRDDVELVDYLVSFRAHPTPRVRRLPLPAAIAHRLWAHHNWPRADRWLDAVDVVHGTNYVVPPSSLPRVVSVYDCWFLRHPELAHGDVRRSGAVLRRAVENGAVVHASSYATAAAVRELMPGAQVLTVHLGALPLAPLPSTAPIADLAGKPFIVAIGTLERRKNLPRLVQAFGRVASTDPDVGLVLAGAESDDRVAIDAAVDSLGPAAHRVSFTGRINESVRSWLLHNAAVLAYPSLDEGFGFPLLDAMQAGVPVVASDAGSIPEVAGDAALLSPAADVDALATNLIAALTDSALRERLVQSGTIRWQGFTWQRCAGEMADLYRRAAEGDAR